MSLTLLSWFRQKISGSEEFVSKETFDIYITEAHSELLRKGGIDVEKSKLERNILRVKRRAAEIQPTMQRIVTPTVRVALLELIVKCEEEKVHVTNKGNPLKIFLAGNPLVNNSNVSVLLRMLLLAPFECECRKILLENLLIYASMKADIDGMTPK